MDLIFHQMWTAWVFRVQGQVLGLLAQSSGPRESATLQPEPTQGRTSRARVHVGVWASVVGLGPMSSLGDEGRP